LRTRGKERKKDGQEKVDELTRKVLQLNVKDDAYATAYAQLFVLAPEMTENLPLPSRFGASDWSKAADRLIEEKKMENT